MSQELVKRIISSIILIPIALFFIIKGGILFNLFILLCFLITIYEWHSMSKKKSYKILGFCFDTYIQFIRIFYNQKTTFY